MAFATLEDLATYIKQDLTAADAATASQMLDIATGAIRNYTGQIISAVANDSVTLDAEGSRFLFLPELPVTSVDSVTVDGDALTFADDYHWSTTGIIERVGYTWGTVRRSVVVVYDHGYTTIPDAIRGACLWMASDMFQRSTGLSAQSMSIDGYAVTWAREAVQKLPGNVQMLLDSYRFKRVA